MAADNFYFALRQILTVSAFIALILIYILMLRGREEQPQSK